MNAKPETNELPPLTEPGRGRRQTERALAAWEETLSELGRVPTIADVFATIDTDEWSYGFIVVVDPVVEASSLLTYGANFAKLLDMPPKGRPFIKITMRLPKHYTEVFTRGCVEACTRNAPVHAEGEMQREDGQKELYRAMFLPIDPQGSPLIYAFGRFNSKIVEE